MKVLLSLSILTALILPLAAAGDEILQGQAKHLYQQAQSDGRFSRDAEKIQADILPTSDGKSFFAVWRGTKSPSHWIVSLHGAGFPAKGYATDDLAIWYPHIKGRNVGIVCLQWWFGKGSSPQSFYSPIEINREAQYILEKLKATPGKVMLEGFSRGSTNTYPVAALDATRGKKYFSLNVASSGAVSQDYPPVRALESGEYGEKPLKNTNWITVAGGRDPHSDRDGIQGMRRTAEWLRSQGARVLETIEDPESGHGAFHRNPENARRVLDRFLK